MKAIVNHIAAVSVLEILPKVNASQIGCIGHSLGGTNALFSTFFDHRIKATVVSAGITTFQRYAETSKTGNLLNWSLRNKYMPNIKLKYKNDPSNVPFDFPELLASLAYRPIFISAPKKDEIFDYLGAKQCIEFSIEVNRNSDQTKRIKYTTPNSNHDFPKYVRKSAYKFLQKSLNNNGN